MIVVAVDIFVLCSCVDWLVNKGIAAYVSQEGTWVTVALDG
jgi:hypothetical protein